MYRRTFVDGAVLSICALIGGCLSDVSTTDARNRNRTDGEYTQPIHVVNRTEETWKVSVEFRSDDVVFDESVVVPMEETETMSVTLDTEERYTLEVEREDGEIDSLEVTTGDDDHDIEIFLDEQTVSIVQLTTD